MKKPTLFVFASFVIVALAAPASAQDGGVTGGTAPTLDACRQRVNEVEARAAARGATMCGTSEDFREIFAACGEYLAHMQAEVDAWIERHCPSAVAPRPRIVPTPTPVPPPVPRERGRHHDDPPPPPPPDRCREDYGAVQVGDRCVCPSREVTYADGRVVAVPRILVRVGGTRHDYGCALTEEGGRIVATQIFEERIREYRAELDRMHTTDADLQRQIDELRRRLEAVRPGTSYDDGWIRTEIAGIRERLENLERRMGAAEGRLDGHDRDIAELRARPPGASLFRFEPSIGAFIAIRPGGGPLSGGGMLSLQGRVRMVDRLHLYARADVGVGEFGNGMGTVFYAGGALGLYGELTSDGRVALFGGFRSHWYHQPGDDTGRDIHGAYRGMDIGGELGLRLTPVDHFFIEFGTGLTYSDSVWVARDAQQVNRWYADQGIGLQPFFRLGITF